MESNCNQERGVFSPMCKLIFVIHISKNHQKLDFDKSKTCTSFVIVTNRIREILCVTFHFVPLKSIRFIQGTFAQFLHCLETLDPFINFLQPGRNLSKYIFYRVCYRNRFTCIVGFLFSLQIVTRS